MQTPSYTMPGSLSSPTVHTATVTSPFSLTSVPPSPTSTFTLDKWYLWTNGAQLRGANIWQRIRVPDLDGDLLGNGYIGPPYAQSDFDRLAAAGANYVNLSIPGLFTERPPYVLDEGAQANLDSLLEMAGRAGLYAVISFRTGPGRSDFTFYRDGAGDWFDPSLLIETVWTEQAAQDAWVEMWRVTAERYRGHPVVVGYDLMVEPNADEVMLEIYDPTEFYPRYAGTLYDWNQFYPRIVAAIRQVDAETPILVNPMGWGSVPWLPYLQPFLRHWLFLPAVVRWGSVPWLPYLQPVDAERIVYAAHQYGPFLYTHQQPGEDKPYPGEFDITWDGHGRAEAYITRNHLGGAALGVVARQFARPNHLRMSVWSSWVWRSGLTSGGRLGRTCFANHSAASFDDSQTSTTCQPPSIGWPKCMMKPGAPLRASPRSRIVSSYPSLV